MRIRRIQAVLGALLMVCLAAPAATAQTGGTVTGSIQDSQGGVIPGATIVLISESRGTRGVPAVTNATGDYVLPNITPDTYTIEVTMPGFRMARRTSVPVSGGERVAVGILVIVPGGTTETVDVTAEAPLIQAESGERSFTISSSQVDSLPLSGNRNYASLSSLAPGVNPGGTGGSRLGGTTQNNVVLDGVSNMETGSNTQNLQLNVEAIAEVRVLVQAYQAEYGRSSGLQVMGVSKSGTNRFRGSAYGIEDNSDLNSNSWANEKNGVPKPVSLNRTYGYSVGGPAGKPGGNNKLFFFYSHEFRPSTSGGNLNRFRVPTALERVGNFSQSLNHQGQPIPQLLDPVTREAYPNNIIPADRLYPTGLQLLNSFPLPNLQQTAPNSYNLEIARPIDKNLVQQPSVRADYQFTPALRLNARWAREGTRRRVQEGTLPGYNDILQFGTYRYTMGATVNYTINDTTFLEATFGEAQNELIGGNSGGLLTSPQADRLTAFPGFPLIYPDAGRVDQRSYQYEMLTRQAASVPWFDGTSVNLIPQINSWGNLISGAPPSLTYPGWITLNRTRDISIAATKIKGRHTFKGGFYSNRAFKPQNTGAGGGGGGTLFQGQIRFDNSTNNPADTGYGFANAATGVFTEYVQSSKLIEGRMIYNNIEAFVQDNWRVSNRLTLDYGLRFTHQGPFYDTLGQMSNFFAPGAPGRPSGVDAWSAADAPLLYVPGCRNNLTTCSGNNRMAKHPVTGVLLDHPAVLNSAFAIGTIIPNSGNRTNGIRVGGDGIATSAYIWPTVAVGPRIGLAYDLRGDQSLVVRGGVGTFFDRTDGNTVFSIPNNPPTAETTTLVNGRLQTINAGISTQGASDLRIQEYDGKLPSQTQWNVGVQLALPWASTVDVSYVGNHGYNRHGSTIHLNQVNLGAAYLPQNQDPTLAPSAVPGATALATNLLRPMRGYGSIQEQRFEYSDTYHSIQTSLNRRYRSGLSFGLNYTWSIAFTGTTGLPKRLQHNADGSFSVRADQADYERLNKDIGIQPHVFRGNAVWDLPDLRGDGAARRVVGAVINDWHVSSVFSLTSGSNYDINFSYQNNGAAVNLTGSPDFGNNGTGARIVFIGDPGSGCSSNQYAQFNTAAVVGPTYGSVGLESARNAMRGCMRREVDMSLARDIRMGGGRSVQLRLDAFNAFNIVDFTGRSSSVQYNNPTSMTVQNAQYAADGTLVSNRLTPQTAGFGAVTSAGNMRTVRLMVRFAF